MLRAKLVGVSVSLLATFVMARPLPQTELRGATIVLPPKLVAGQLATLAVLSDYGGVISDVAVQLPDGAKITTDGTGRAQFMAPSSRGVLVAELAGKSTSAAAVIVASEPSGGIQIAQAPEIISLHDQFFVYGSGFRADASADHVVLGGQTALVLASSPASLVVLPGPGAPPGPAELSVRVGASKASMKTALVAFELGTPKSVIAAEKKAALEVRVLGTQRPVELEVLDYSPSVAQLVRGYIERITTTGGADNRATIELKTLRPGNLNFGVRLLPGPAGRPDVQSALLCLEAARRASHGKDSRRIGRMIRLLSRPSPKAAEAEKGIARFGAENPSGELGALLRAVEKYLLNP